MNRSVLFSVLAAAMLMLAACSDNDSSSEAESKATTVTSSVTSVSSVTETTFQTSQAETSTAAESYNQITQEQAKEMMQADDGHIIVDVRRQDEFDSGHIPGAICIPNESIENEKPPELPDTDQIIFIYCRSGRRSKEAAQKLFDMGYTNIYEFGGIIDWTGEIETGQ